MSKFELEEEELNKEEGTSLENAEKIEDKDKKIEDEIADEIQKITENAKNIQHEVDSLGGEAGLKEALGKKDVETNNNIVKTVRKIVLAGAALASIPVVATIVNPEIINNISNFINSSNGEVAGVAVAGVSLVALIAVNFLDKEHGLNLKDFFGPNKSILEELEDKRREPSSNKTKKQISNKAY